jgi:uncharacterized membrane protein (DUF2068 family)
LRIEHRGFVLWYLIIERGIRGLAALGIGGYALAFLRHDLTQFVRSVETFLATSDRDTLYDQYVGSVLDRLVNLSPRQVSALAAVAILYGAVELAESVGLLLRRRWAEYLVVIATGFGIPIEIRELFHHATLVKGGLFVANVLIVVYLVWRKRLFIFGETVEER